MDEVMNMKNLYIVRDEKNARKLLYIDDHRNKAFINGRECCLTRQEFCLLKELACHSDEPVSREVILKNAWGFQLMGETRTVDVHVQRLRRKLGSSAIETIYRYGYRLCAEAV